MVTETDTWVWYDSSITHPLATSSRANFENSLLASPDIDRQSYTDNATWVDQNDDGRIDDIDTYTISGFSEHNDPPAGEGIEIDGAFQQVSTFAIFNGTVTVNDNGVESTINVEIAVYQLEDGSVAYRLEDSQIQSLQAAGYRRSDITEITLTSFKSYHRSPGPTGHDDAFPCFTAGTLIDTATGLTPVEDLRCGDLVRTLDHGDQPIIWIGRRTLRVSDRPELRPVMIRRNVLGRKAPLRDLRVSQQHRMLVRSPIAQRMFQTQEVLVAAKKLVEIEGIEIDHSMDRVTYVHFMCQDHQVVFAEGAPSESLYWGAETRKILGEAQMQELFGIFPELRRAAPPVPARLLVKGRQAQRLVYRHHKNRKHLLEALV